MLDWLGDIQDPAALDVLTPWQTLAAEDHTVGHDWAEYLVEVFQTIKDQLPPLLADWGDAYDHALAAPRIAKLAESLLRGVPQADLLVDGATVLALDSDIVNAAWVARISPDVPEALYRLVEKSLESADFLRRWENAGGDVQLAAPDVDDALDELGLLTDIAIHRRLAADGDERLIVTPLLPGAVKETSIDLRLGRYFIVFQRASTGTFDALSDDDDPRTMQRSVERRWGEAFVLHPGELVLAATFEYLVLPNNLGAQVITRSSYGRLGLLTATAIQIHPLFRGCLTLELANLGALPISLYPGQRVAQLALTTATPDLATGAVVKYDCPTRPEFSRVRSDPDAPILRRLGTNE